MGYLEDNLQLNAQGLEGLVAMSTPAFGLKISHKSVLCSL